MESIALKKSVAIWFVVAVCIMVLNAAFIYACFQKFHKQKYLVEHTYEVITNLEGTIGALSDIQAAQRGYVITGTQDYLAPYALALPKVEEYLSALSGLLHDNPKQSERLNTLKGEVNRRLEIAEDVIGTFEEKGQKAAFDMIKTGTGKREMDQIRSTIHDMIAEEKKLLAIRQGNVDQASYLTLVAGGFGLGLCIVILAFVFSIIRREMYTREEAEQTLLNTLSETKRISKENEQLSQLADYLQGCQTVDEAYTILSHNLPAFLPGTSGSIALYNNSRNQVRIMGSWGDYEKMEGEYNPDDCWALRRGQIHHVSPSGTEPLCAHAAGRTSGGSVCYPMQAHGDTVGVFYVSAKDEKDIDENRCVLIRRIGEQAALAISNLKLRERLRDQSVRDALTRLFNRRYLEETMDREMSRARRNGQPLSTLVLDIDHFKRYNDTLGHDAGDALLVQFAQLLQTKIRKEDIACRYGGEEFVIVLPQASVDMAELRAKEIVEATRAMKVKLKNGDSTTVTVSIGVSTFPLHGASPEELITMADKALYRAKDEGRNTVRVAAS